MIAYMRSFPIPAGIKCSVCGHILNEDDLKDHVTNQDCRWVPLDDFVGLDIEKILERLNEKLDGIYSLAPSDHHSYSYVAQAGHSLFVSVIELRHKNCSKS